MNEDFNLDGGHEIDDLFRNALSNHTESPSNDAWNKLNHKLNRKEVVDFVTLKKVPGTEGVSLPLYRQQWFRVAVAASVALLILFSSFFIINRTANNLNDPNHNIANKSIYPHSKTSYGVDDYNHIADYHSTNPESLNNTLKDDNFIAENNNRVENLDRMPVNHENNNSLQHMNDQNTIANNRNDHKINKNQESNSNQNNNDNIANSNNQNIYLPNNSISNNNQPIIADNSNNNGNPILGINNQNNQNNGNQDNYSVRNQAVNAVDSLIRANAIKDSLLLINDQNSVKNNSIDSNNEELLIQDQGNGSDNKNENQEIVPIFPNVFTPDGDGLNEYFTIGNLDHFPDNNLIIQDRKGKIVYREKEYRGNWNANGVEDGTYFYVFTYKNEKYETIAIKGIIYVIR
jgi:gliding motility-associated-like protein